MRFTQNDALSDFAGGLAHELANIFTAAAGNLSLLDENCQRCKECGMALHDIRRATKRGLDLTMALKAIAGRQALTPSRCEINHELALVLNDWKRGLPSNIAARFAPAAEPCTAILDREKFHGMIGMLVDNARAAMPNGGTLLVTTKVLPAADGERQVLIDICDNGIGMSEEAVARAFDPLVKNPQAGIRRGWGLAISAGFVRQTGGTIELRSKPLEGTCVSIQLPLA